MPRKSRLLCKVLRYRWWSLHCCEPHHTVMEPAVNVRPHAACVTKSRVDPAEWVGCLGEAQQAWAHRGLCAEHVARHMYPAVVPSQAGHCTCILPWCPAKPATAHAWTARTGAGQHASQLQHACCVVALPGGTSADAHAQDASSQHLFLPKGTALGLRNTLHTEAQSQHGFELLGARCSPCIRCAVELPKIMLLGLRCASIHTCTLPSPKIIFCLVWKSESIQEERSQRWVWKEMPQALPDYECALRLGRITRSLTWAFFPGTPKQPKPPATLPTLTWGLSSARMPSVK